MWYIAEAEEGAGIYLGFKREVIREEYESAIKENRLSELLNFYEVKAGECYFIQSELSTQSQKALLYAKFSKTAISLIGFTSGAE